VFSTVSVSDKRIVFRRHGDAAGTDPGFAGWILVGQSYKYATTEGASATIWDLGRAALGNF